MGYESKMSNFEGSFTVSGAWEREKREKTRNGIDAGAWELEKKIIRKFLKT